MPGRFNSRRFRCACAWTSQSCRAATGTVWGHNLMCYPRGAAAPHCSLDKAGAQVPVAVAFMDPRLLQQAALSTNHREGPEAPKGRSGDP